jgi:hypothetical protein
MKAMNNNVALQNNNVEVSMLLKFFQKLYKNPVPTSHKAHSISITKADQLTFWKTISVCLFSDS